MERQKSNQLKRERKISEKEKKKSVEKRNSNQRKERRDISERQREKSMLRQKGKRRDSDLRVFTGEE